MGRHLRFALKSVCLIVLLFCCLQLVNRALVPKYYYNNKWSATSTYQGFYKMEENTIDVIFLGSSHAACAFNPQELYNTYGITSYNLGCEQQNLLVSYYWLREALRSQNPKVVMLECYMLFEYMADEPLNTEEACTRKAIDYMKWSEVKQQAVEDICLYDEGQQVLSYYLPNVRFHTRWTDLDEDDFAPDEMEQYYELKGYNLLYGNNVKTNNCPLTEGASWNGEIFISLMEEYLQKISDLCEEQGIELILVKTPTSKQTIEKYNTVKTYAGTHGLDYYDFNLENLYEETGFVYAQDMADEEHTNVQGAIKITDYIGNLLGTKYQIAGHVDAQWQDSAWFYEMVKKDYQLCHETNLCNYLSMLDDERYAVFITAMDEASNGLSVDARGKLAELGLMGGSNIGFGNSYYGAITKDGIVEQLGDMELENSGALRDGRVLYQITSAGYNCGNSCSIKIGGKEYAKKKRGLNIVVYDYLTRKVIDSVCFDTWETEWDAYR